MLTATQRVKCRELAESLDRGEADAYQHAEPSLSGEERLAIFNTRTNFAIWAERGARMVAERSRQAVVAVERCGRPSKIQENLPELPKGKTRDVAAMSSLDLDFWADDVAPVEPDDDDDGQPCAVCDGRGKDSAGNICTACNGSGKAPSDDEDEDDDHELEEE